ncbi:MAG: Nramp family divalent metal transporter [Candidatus Eremiobacteraeota bacterium]|nr:Nramp family divalent metal transporter [Candidatus Eremiobacteraeota bacterium]MCW5868805.1 Nramp family divalent metal transporter [Candidatus Eremiobacteraeota bacterium]
MNEGSMLPLATLSPESSPSLPEVHRTVSVPKGGPWLRKFLTISGPAYLVSVGYMDPGNWATDLAGGSKFGYQLLWVVLLSNLMAIFLQNLCVRMGVVARLDLAQACRDYYPRPAAIILWLLCEVAIIACDLAEVIGSAIGLNLLFGIPLVMGVLLTGADVLLLLGLMHWGFRKLEALVITLVLTIGFCFAVQIFQAQPDWLAVTTGLLHPSMPNLEALAISLGILGATVMPHNLYLHSALVQTRDTPDIETSLRANKWDTIIALGGAFFVNAGILILAAAVFHPKGLVVDELQQAHELLTPMLGGTAATLFAVALLCSGQSSTVTGTLAGQIVMEGFLHIKIKAWVRRLITRLLALGPALWAITATGGSHTVQMLVISQVVLSMQLPFAIFPLVQFTSDPERMGEYANSAATRSLAYLIGTAISTLNFYLLYTELGNWGLLLAGLAVGFWIYLYRARR